MIDFKYQKKTKETGKGIVFMYNENENNDLGRTTPEEHKEEPITTNFTMRDPDPEEAARENGYESKETQPEYTRQESRSIIVVFTVLIRRLTLPPSSSHVNIRGMAE